MNCPRCNGSGKIQRCIGHQGRGAVFICWLCGGAGRVTNVSRENVLKAERERATDHRYIAPQSIMD